jgi:hypothetical protein
MVFRKTKTRGLTLRSREGGGAFSTPANFGMEIPILLAQR